MKIIIVALLLSLTLLSCGNGESKIDSGNRDGILHWGNGDEPQELDPHIVTGVPEHHILVALLEGLVAKDPETLQPIPAVAQSWQISEDGRVYQFNIRSDARWSNGDPLTAEDFVWSWRRALLPALGNQYGYMYAPIKNAEAFHRGEISDFDLVGVHAPDPQTLIIELDNPTPYFLQLLDHYSMFPVHRDTLEKFGDAAERGTRWTRAGNFVGNGPFVLEQWKLNRIIKVKKNSRYWDANRVQLNGIHFYPTQNISTEERMFRAGQLHHTNEVPVSKIARYRENNPEALHISPYLGTYFYRLNVRLPQLSDKRVRQALAMSIDRDKLVTHVTKAGQLPAYSITPPGTLGYQADSNLHYDPVRARELLAEAGFNNGEGFPTLEILYNTQEEHRKIAVAIQQMWKRELNINISLLNQDWKVYLARQARGDYQITRASWIGDYVDPNSFLDMWLAGGGNNRTGWYDKEYDRLIQQLAPTASTQAQRFAAFRAAEKILMDELPIIPIYHYVSKHLLHPSVSGMPENILNYALYKNISLQPESEN